MKPLPHQIVGADWLADRATACLADEPRVGKTGTAIMAADLIGAKSICVITTASGRAVWARAFAQWSRFERDVQVMYKAPIPQTSGVLIVGWAGLQALKDSLYTHFDLMIVDESHYAKSVEAKRTQILFGVRPRDVWRDHALVDRADRVWCLTGTPVPNAPVDLFPMLMALTPDRMWDVRTYDSFLYRYCVVRKKRVTPWTEITIPIGGRNLEELSARLDGFMLRRTQAEVGITRPQYDLLPIAIGPSIRKEIEATVPGAEEVLAAAETGETKSLDMALGTLRRITGAPKAAGVAQAVRDEFESSLKKVVLMCWHHETMDKLCGLLREYGVVRVDGATSAKAREEAVQRFSTDPAYRVFVGQITACGEAIDLSAASELIFVESSWVPKDMAQAALRITNHTQAVQPRVRVAALAGSIDEALQEVLLRKVSTIREILK